MGPQEPEHRVGILHGLHGSHMVWDHSLFCPSADEMPSRLGWVLTWVSSW